MLSAVLTPEHSLLYTYDFGDNWEHTITLVKTDKRKRKKATLNDAEGQTPLEDCGSYPGWENLHGLTAQAYARDVLPPASEEAYHHFLGDLSPTEAWEFVSGLDEVRFKQLQRDTKRADPYLEPLNSEEDFDAAELIGKEIRELLDGLNPPSDLFQPPRTPDLDAVRTHIRNGEHLEAIAEYLASDYVDRLVHHFRQLPKRTLDDAHLTHLGTALQRVLQLVTGELKTFHRTGRKDVAQQHKVVTAAKLGNIPLEMLAYTSSGVVNFLIDTHLIEPGRYLETTSLGQGMLDASPVEAAHYFLFVLPPSLGSEYAIYTGLLLDAAVGEKARQDFNDEVRFTADDLVAWFDFIFYTYGLLTPDPHDSDELVYSPVCKALCQHILLHLDAQRLLPDEG